MKSFLAFLILTTPLYADEPYIIEVPFDRQDVIGSFLIEQESVRPFIDLAIGKYFDLSEYHSFDKNPHNRDDRDKQKGFEASKIVHVTEVNCDEHPYSRHGNTHKNYCSFKGRSAFGWYADPYFGYSVSGFILRDRVLEGSLTEPHMYELKNGDGSVFSSIKQNPIIITEVAVQTPIRTGLE